MLGATKKFHVKSITGLAIIIPTRAQRGYLKKMSTKRIKPINAGIIIEIKIYISLATFYL